MKDIEQALRESGMYLTTTEGDSMFPMLKTGDKVMIVKPSFPLKKYDIPVYRRDGHYTMHRIIKVTKKGYVICGDNRVRLEKDIREADIVGVFAGMQAGKKFIPADSEELLAFAERARRTYPLRLLRYCLTRTARKLGIKRRRKT